MYSQRVSLPYERGDIRDSVNSLAIRRKTCLFFKLKAPASISQLVVYCSSQDSLLAVIRRSGMSDGWRIPGTSESLAHDISDQELRACLTDAVAFGKRHFIVATDVRRQMHELRYCVTWLTPWTSLQRHQVRDQDCAQSARRLPSVFPTRSR